EGHSSPDEFAYTVARRLSEASSIYNGEGPQSPIEHMLLGAMMWLQLDWAGFPTADALGGPEAHEEIRGRDIGDRLEFFITPQASVGSYRVDFLVWFAYKTHKAGIAIECDGHAFHEKTK